MTLVIKASKSSQMPPTYVPRIPKIPERIVAIIATEKPIIRDPRVAYGRDYVLAAKISGERPWRVIVVEILPNLLPCMASQFVFAVIFAILGESSLSFIDA